MIYIYIYIYIIRKIQYDRGEDLRHTNIASTVF